MPRSSDPNDPSKGKGAFKKREFRPWKPALLEAQEEGREINPKDFSFIEESENRIKANFESEINEEIGFSKLENVLEVKTIEKTQLAERINLSSENRILFGGFLKPHTIIAESQNSKRELLLNELQSKEKEIMEISLGLKMQRAKELIERTESARVCEEEARLKAEKSALHALEQTKALTEKLLKAEEQISLEKRTRIELDRLKKFFEEKASKLEWEIENRERAVNSAIEAKKTAEAKAEHALQYAYQTEEKANRLIQERTRAIETETLQKIEMLEHITRNKVKELEEINQNIQLQADKKIQVLQEQLYLNESLTLEKTKELEKIRELEEAQHNIQVHTEGKLKSVQDELARVEAKHSKAFRDVEKAHQEFKLQAENRYLALQEEHIKDEARILSLEEQLKRSESQVELEKVKQEQLKISEAANQDIIQEMEKKYQGLKTDTAKTINTMQEQINFKESVIVEKTKEIHQLRESLLENQKSQLEAQQKHNQLNAECVALKNEILNYQNQISKLKETLHLSDKAIEKQKVIIENERQEAYIRFNEIQDQLIKMNTMVQPEKEKLQALELSHENLLQSLKEKELKLLDLEQMLASERNARQELEEKYRNEMMKKEMVPKTTKNAQYILIQK